MSKVQDGARHELPLRRVGLHLCSLALSATLFWFGTGLTPWWPLTWLAPLPVLLLAAESSWWSLALAAFLALPLGMLNLFHLLHDLLHVPVAAIASIYVTSGLVFALAALLFRALLRRRATWSALLGFPALLVCFEWLSSLTSPHGTGGSLAYSQLGFLPFLQLASVTGPWGMSFVLLMLPAALALAWQLRASEPRTARSMLVLTGSVLLAVLGFGTLRLMHAPPADSLVKVGLVASDGANEDVAEPGRATEMLTHAYEHSLTELAKQGAEVVVLPEKLGVVLDPDTQRLDAQLGALSERLHIQIVIGLIRVAQGKKYNEARVYTPGRPCSTTTSSTCCRRSSRASRRAPSLPYCLATAASRVGVWPSARTWTSPTSAASMATLRWA